MIAGYVSQRTWLHRIPIGLKLIAIAGLSILLLPITDWRPLAAALGCLLLIYASLGWKVFVRIGDLKPLVPILVAIAVLHVWFDDLFVAAASILRILVMVMAASLLTLTTPMRDMIATLTPLFTPLRFVGISPRAPALAIALVLRFLPVLLSGWQEREEAWKARTGRRASLRLIPSFIAKTLRIADQVAEALDARGFDPSARSRQPPGPRQPPGRKP